MAKKKVNVTVDYKVKGADDVEGAFDGVAESADNASESVQKVGESTGGLKGAFQSAQGGVKGLISGFKAVIANPIGAVIAAVVVAVQLLSEMFANNEAASNKLGQGFAYLKGLLLPLQKAFFAAFDAIVFAIEKPGEAWDAIVSGIEAGFNFLKTVVFDPYLAVWSSLILGIEKGILKVRIAWNEWTGDADEAARLTLRLEEVNQKLSENADTIIKAGETVIDTAVAIGNAVADVVEEADKMGSALVALTKREQDLTKAKREQEIQNAKSLAQLEQLKVIRDDESKSLEERREANKDIADVEAARVDAALKLGEKELQLLRDKAALEGEGAEILDLITEKEIELAELNNENAGIRAEQRVNDVNLRREQFEKEAAIIDQQLQLDSVLEQSAVKIADAKIKAEEEKLAKLAELNLQETQQYRDQQFNLEMAQKEAQKARLDAQKEADALLIEQNAKTKAQQDQDDKDAAKLKLDTQKALNDGISNLANSLSSALGENSKAALVIQKAVALRTIAIDTAQAISGLVKASAQNKLNGVTAGGAGALQFATGILQIGANMAKAYSILKQPAPQIDAGGGGGGSTAPETQQTAPDLGFEGRSAGTEQFGANIPIRAYVTETDITTSQNTATNIQELSQIG